MAPCSRSSSSIRGQPNQRAVSSAARPPSRQVAGTRVCLTDEVAADTEACCLPHSN